MTISWPRHPSASLTKSQKSKRELARIESFQIGTKLTHLDDAQEATGYMRGHRLGQSNSCSDGEV